MSDVEKGQSILEKAYELSTPADNARHYDAFAATYDSDFAADLGWSCPRAVAHAYSDAAGTAGAEDAPIADIGRGTGLVAAELGAPLPVVDGMDISPEMLAIAREKGLRRELYEVDLTGDLAGIPTDDGAVISAGTFTHGHLRPEVLRSLLNLARPGALFVIGINKDHFAGQGFAASVNAMATEGLIDAPAYAEVRMYDKDGHDHSGDVAIVARYRKAP